MRIYTAGSIRSTRWRGEDITWRELTDRLRNVKRTAETSAEYATMNKAERGGIKGSAGAFVGGELTGRRRVREAVRNRCLITLDADNAKAGDWDTATCLCDDTQMCCYSTHSHTKLAPRLRWVIPLKREVSAEEYEPVARLLAEDMGIINTLDASTFEVHRGMYWPTASADGEYIFHVWDPDYASPADPDALLARLDRRSEKGWRDAGVWPIGEQEKEIVLHEVKRQADPESKPGIVGQFCRIWDIPSAIDTFLPDVYESAGEGRYTFIGGSTYAGAVLYNDGAFLFSHHSTDPAGQQLCNAFDLVRLHKFGAKDDGAMQTANGQSLDTTKLPSYTAMCEWASALPEVRNAAAQERKERLTQAFGDLTGGDPEQTRADTPNPKATEEDNTEWMGQLTLKRGSTLPECTAANAYIILTNDPALKGLHYNQMKEAPVIRESEVPWRSRGRKRKMLTNHDGAEWSDVDDACLRNYLETAYGFTGNGKICDAFEQVLLDRAYHPIREYLNALVWDGTERLDTLFIRWLGAEDTKLNRAMTRKWAAGAVKRVMEPGCKFDQTIALIGPQGVGKSTLAARLAKNPAWFTDSVPVMDSSQRAFEAVRGKWIAEIAENAAAKKSEQEAIKNFISKQADYYRPSYARRAVDFPRQTAFYISTNDHRILKDSTGARRYWTMEVPGTGDCGVLTGLTEDEVDQIWAEAVQVYRSGESLWLDNAELRQDLAAVQERFTVEDSVRDDVLEFLDRPRPANWDDLSREARRDFIQGMSLADESKCTYRINRVCVAEIKYELYGMLGGDRGRSELDYAISRALDSVKGWSCKGRTTHRPWGSKVYWTRDSYGICGITAKTVNE